VAVEDQTGFDEDGFLKDPNSWSSDIANAIAKKQFDIELTENHMRVINFVREYYFKWGAIPMVKAIRDAVGLSNVQLDELFKRGSSTARGVICKISGLPKLLCIASGC
jgi:tRNA 2-thiouridine synthesizing protein E